MSTNEQKKVDIVLYSPIVKKCIKKRFEELDLKATDVIKDAITQGMTTLTKEKLSRYLNNDVPIKGFPTQRDILWLATRYSIRIKLVVDYGSYDPDIAIPKAKEILKEQ